MPWRITKENASPRNGWHEQCDGCKRWFPRRTLVRQLQVGTAPAATNRLPYSSYDTSGWSCTATDGGAVSMGRSDYYVQFNWDSTCEHKGLQCWTGDGTLAAAAGIDCSSYSSLLISAHAGLWHETCGSMSSAVELEIGLVADDATEYAAAPTWSLRGSRRIWGVVLMSAVSAGHLSSLAPYFTGGTVDGDEAWYVDGMQAVENLTECGNMLPFVETTGAAVSTSADAVEYRAVVVCKKCRGPRLDVIPQMPDSTATPPEMREDLEVS